MEAQQQLKVGVYARISEDKDGQQMATARQLEDCKVHCERRGWELVDQFEDIDTSAFDTKVKRPEFERMLLALRAGEIDGIVVWKLDRLSRQQRDLVRVIEACEARKAFIASVTESIDTREPHGQFIAEMLVAQARMESANTAARQRRKAKEQKELGMPPTNGRRCFGYLRGYKEQVPEEAAILREVKDRILAGETLNSVSYDLEVRGILGTQGSAWRPPILKRLLISPTIAGMRVHEGLLIPGTWERIITPEEHERLKVVLNKRAGMPRLASARKRLLTGFVRCARCGGRMAAQSGWRGRYLYVCKKQPGYPNCGKMSVVGEPLEELVKEMVFAAIDDEALAEALQAKGEADDGLIDAIRRDETALETLSNDYYVEHLISREEFFPARGRLQERLEGNRARLAKRNGSGKLGQFLGDGGALRAAWEAGSLEWRRSVIGALIEHVVVAPGKPGRVPFDPGRVTPVWRY